MRTPRPRVALVGVALTLALAGAACSNDSDSTAGGDGETTEASATTGPSGPGCAAVPPDGAGSFDAMEVEPVASAASQNPLLTTLVTAVGAADLVETLNGEGPFTVFAPANSAFAEIPANDLDALLADTEALSEVLTYHVVSGEMTAEDLLAAGTVESLEGTPLEISEGGDTFRVDGVEVLCENVSTSNAIVHVIGEVLVPEDAAANTSGPAGPACSALPANGDGSAAVMAGQPVATAASGNELLSTLATAVGEAGLVDTLNDGGPYTVFAPVNDAFDAIPAADLEAILADEEQLTEILTYHVVSGEMSSEELISAGTVETLQTGDLEIVKAGETFTVNGADVLCADVPTANATVFLIDGVLVPS